MTVTGAVIAPLRTTLNTAAPAASLTDTSAMENCATTGGGDPGLAIVPTIV